MTIRKIQIAAPAKKTAPKSKKDEKPKLGKGAAEPTAYFASLEANRKGSMKVMKKQWAKAVKKAEAEGKGKKGPYIMRIFKNLMGISTASLPGLGNEPSVLDQMPPPGGPEPLVPLRHPFEAAGLVTAGATFKKGDPVVVHHGDDGFTEGKIIDGPWKNAKGEFYRIKLSTGIRGSWETPLIQTKFNFEVWKKSGKKARKTGLTDNEGNLIPRKVHPDLKG